MSEKKLLVRQVRSSIGRDKKFRERLAALGLGRIGNERVLAASPSNLGMIESVKHVLSVSAVK